MLDKYRDGELFAELTAICESEQENGVNNQYLKALKKAEKDRK